MRTTKLTDEILLREFEDVVHFTNPPRVVQRVLFGPLAAIARVLGYKGSYPKNTDSDVRSGGKGEGPLYDRSGGEGNLYSRRALAKRLSVTGVEATPKRLTPPSLAETLPIQKIGKGLPTITSTCTSPTGMGSLSGLKALLLVLTEIRNV